MERYYYALLSLYIYVHHTKSMLTVRSTWARPRERPSSWKPRRRWCRIRRFHRRTQPAHPGISVPNTVTYIICTYECMGVCFIQWLVLDVMASDRMYFRIPSPPVSFSPKPIWRVHNGTLSFVLLRSRPRQQQATMNWIVRGAVTSPSGVT